MCPPIGDAHCSNRPENLYKGLLCKLKARVPMSNLIRLRYNTMADETPGGEWKWRVILEKDGQYEEVLVKELVLAYPVNADTYYM